jgi:hypothetical protein
VGVPPAVTGASRSREGAGKSWSGEFHRKAAYILIPPVFFMGVALTAGTNLGIRHVLPIYPFLILAAAVGNGGKGPACDFALRGISTL